MKVALFGGTFDPVHIGHLAAARAAAKRFGLEQIHFVPASLPPHKRNRLLTPFAHRFAMLALACAGEPQFLPSLIEGSEESGGQPNYSLITVHKMAARLSPGDRLYFLLGADAFLDVGAWHEPVELLDSCDFLVVSRPGFSITELERVIPLELQPAAPSGNSIALRRTQVHLLNTVTANVSSSEIRRLLSEGKSVRGMVPDLVEEYIRKLHLYQDAKPMERSRVTGAASR